jgi:3-phenylpropionate/cinnamic acid dioxygenase small subunit
MEAAMTTPHDVTAEQLVKLVLHEARLLDARDHEAWNRLFTDDAIYWVPLEHDQPDGIDHTSHLYEDKLLRELRIERLKSPRAFSQQPHSRCHHLLQTPSVESMDAAANHFVTRTEFHYSEARGDEMLMLVGTAFHHFRVEAGELRFTHKRVNLLNCDAALPSIQLFI